MTPEELAQFEARLMAEVSARVAEADRRMAELRAEAERRMQSMLAAALARLGLGPPPALEPPGEPAGENPTAGPPAPES